MSAPDVVLKAWEDYMANCQSVIHQSTLNPGCSAEVAPMPFAGAWQDLARSFGISTDAASDTAKRENPFSNIGPAFGATREYQQIAQRMLELGFQFQRQYEDFVKLGAGIQQRAQHRASTQSTSAASLAADPAATYDAWIEGAEDAYAQVAQSDAFARSLGELINLLSKFKTERGKLQEAVARALDLPSRSEVDTLHRQVRELTLALRSATAPKGRKPAKP